MIKTISEEKNSAASPWCTFLFCFYLFYCFFEPYINQIIGGYGRYIILIVIFFFITSYKIIKIELFHLSIIIWLVLKIVSILWVSFNQIVQQHFISQVGCVGLFIALTVVSFGSKFIDRIIHTLLYSSFLVGILCLFFNKPFNEVTTRHVLTIQGVQLDPNNQAAFLLIGISIAAYYLLNRKCKVGNSLLLLSIVIINTYAMFLTGSRGGLMSLVLIALTLSLLSEKGSHLISKHTTINFIIVLFIILVTFLLAKNFLTQDKFDRLFDFSTYGGGSNRVNIWENAVHIFLDHPLNGGGWGSYWGYNGYYVVIHNTILSILVDGGLIGITLFFLPVLAIIINALKQKYVLPIVILISGFAPSLFIDAINKRFFWNAIIVAMMLIISKLNMTSKITANYSNPTGECPSGGCYDQI